MKIYTKTGDKGYTSLIGGTRVPKHHVRIESYGTIDELNSWIGLIRDQQIDTAHKEILKQIQETLFVIGSQLAADPERSKMSLPELDAGEAELLEKAIDNMNEGLPDLTHFILPGGSTVVSYCHLARCVCRRAERAVTHLAENSTVNDLTIIYLNRLSDYLFVLGRKLANELNVAENQWIPERKKN
ncbi:cob(I)yrinic acid a,c-diamide adenosyltransferase [Mucilaginibacter calamicampi]|uniref:Corrinoid adenosyltransferase n=1 Tax=Mucilaginibacter calamicampi TaxID=1302352 RepID=A0ABW2YSP6_9SPHI